MIKPNYTQISNDFLDNEMHLLAGSIVKIFLVISRKTIGWHKDTDPISYSQIREYTGIGSKSTISNGLAGLIARGLIIASKKKGGTTVYELDMTGPESEQATSPITGQGVSNNWTGTSPITGHTKETPKDTTKRNKTSVQKDARIKTLIDFYYNTFKDRTGREATVSGAWGKGFQRLLVHNTEDEIRAVVSYFFAYRDRTQFSFTAFLGKFDNLAPMALKSVGRVEEGKITWEKISMEEAQRLMAE